MKLSSMPYCRTFWYSEWRILKSNQTFRWSNHRSTNRGNHLGKQCLLHFCIGYEKVFILENQFALDYLYMPEIYFEKVPTKLKYQIFNNATLTKSQIEYFKTLDKPLLKFFS